jgi:hypothetical protein
MTRRVTAGAVGGAGVAGLQAFTTRITSAANLDITVDPVGTGRFLIAGDAQLQNQSDLRFADSDNSNWVGFQAPGTISADVLWTLPSTDGTNNQVLTTNGSGTLTWSNKSVTIQDNTTDSNTNYIFFSPSTSGEASVARVSTPNLTFQPSTGTFTATAIVESSSITLKENITPIENALDTILKLDGVIYDRKDGSKTGEAGLIAEWVNEVLPNLVTKDARGNPIGINYTKFSAYLIEAVKSLKAEIDSLKKDQ